MDRETFREQLLAVMDQKRHWAWAAFTSGRVPKEKLHYHFEQEYGAYVRDFPVMVGWAYVQCPIAAVRRSLAANLYEEETGGLVAGKPHPELFLEYPRGLGMDLSRFEKIQLLPAAQRYRNFLDEALHRFGWDISAALATIFIEGTSDERATLSHCGSVAPPPLEEHPLVKFYGLKVEHLALTKAHREVEGGHRVAAWKAILENVVPMRRGAVVRAMEEALRHWLLYRDEVAALCGVRADERNCLGAVA
ncbi:MAG TPA: iron-containing redox enzyme family protein [Terriglobales bacterium]|jgi:pyrroloquinoline-quinone synthase|nr:iron-containing redox enzyme family protein [Terriglobales bacterium]